MPTKSWKPFPHPDPAFDYGGAKLAKAWAKLHAGDCEPLPDAKGVKAAQAANPGLKSKAAPDEVAERLADAWRAYHRGDFAKAVDSGLALGLIGTNVANKAANIYATYLEKSEKAQLAIFEEVIARAEELIAAAPGLANAWYLHAQAIGRYSQGISIGKALAQGLAGKVSRSLEKAIALEPKHADAHIAFGAYHAEIINKVGGMIGGLTYGASKEAAVKHYETALKLNPRSAIARIEYANGLVMIFGDSRMKQAVKLYEEAAAADPADAMEWLDVEAAREELAD